VAWGALSKIVGGRQGRPTSTLIRSGVSLVEAGCSRSGVAVAVGSGVAVAVADGVAVAVRVDVLVDVGAGVFVLVLAGVAVDVRVGDCVPNGVGVGRPGPPVAVAKLVSVAVGGDEDAGEMRTRLITGGGSGHAGDRVDEGARGHRHRALARRLGQLGKVLGRKRAQVELRRARHDLHVLLSAAVLQRQLVRRQRTHHNQEQSTGDDCLTRRGFG